METKKNYFAISLNLLGICLFTYALFYGLHMYFNGNLLLSMPTALFMGGLLELIVLNMCRLKKRSTRQHEVKPLLFVLYILYVAIAAISSLFIANMMTIKLKKKAEIQANYLEQERQVERLFAMDENVSYLTYVENRLDWYFKEMKNQRVESSMREANIDTAKDDLLKEYDKILNEKNNVIPQTNRQIKEWHFFKINAQLTEWENKKNEWMKQLVQSSKNHEIGASTPYKASISKDQDLAKMLASLQMKELFGFESLLLIILLHLMILFNFFMIKRNKQGKIKGKKVSGAITY